LIDRLGSVAIQTSDGSPVPDQIILNAIIEAFASMPEVCTTFLCGEKRMVERRCCV